MRRLKLPAWFFALMVAFLPVAVWAITNQRQEIRKEAANLSETSLNQQKMLDSWADEVYRIYQNTDFANLIGELKANTAPTHQKTMIARGLADQAMMHFYFYQRDGREADLSKLKKLVKTITAEYRSWGKVWLSPVTMNQLTFSVWGSWNLLEEADKKSFAEILAEEANFWTWVLEEIKANPEGKTIPESAGRRAGQNNLSLITSRLDSDDHLEDTRAEENGATAQFLATAYNMFPEHPNASSWNQAAKCFAFHTFSQNETTCGITTRTIGDDFVLGNHNLWPSPMYTLAGVTPLQQGEFSYLLAGKAVPEEFYHHLTSGLRSEVWQQNLTACGFNQAGNFEITARCHASKDWGDKNFLIGTIMVAHWAKISGQPTIKTEAETLLQTMLDYFYANYRGRIWAPSAKPIPVLLGDSTHWWKNLEVHVQESAKFFATSHFQETNFRSHYFPFPLTPSSPTPTEITPVNPSATIDTLLYFLPSDGHEVELCHDNGQGGCDETRGIGEYLTNFKLGQGFFKAKWRSPQYYEYYTWDDNYIYLKYDSTWGEDNYFSCASGGKGTNYSFTNGKWAKRQMKIGETLVVADNDILIYKNDCSFCAQQKSTYSNTLEAHYPQFDLGGKLGIQDVIVLRFDMPNSYEKFFLAKGWGHVRWQSFQGHYPNGTLQYDILLNGKSGKTPVFREQKCGDFSKYCLVEKVNDHQVTVSGKANKNQAPENIRLWLENSNRSKINNSGLATSTERVYEENRYYYLLLSMPANGQSQTIALSDLPDDNYFVHCDLATEPAKCSGNPFCAHEGGQDNCDGWISCSNQDNINFSINQPTTSPAPTTAIPTNSPTPTVPRATATPTPPPSVCDSTPRLCYFGQKQCEWYNRDKNKAEFACVQKLIDCGESGQFWNWAYCPSTATTPTTAPAASPTTGPTLVPQPTSPSSPTGCEPSPRLCSFGETQCVRDHAGQSGGQCRLNPDCGTIDTTHLDSETNYWKWSYCYSQPILLPTPTPTPPPSTSEGCEPSPRLCSFGKNQCVRDHASQSGGQCRLNEACGEINQTDLNSPTNYWKWSYCY